MLVVAAIGAAVVLLLAGSPVGAAAAATAAAAAAGIALLVAIVRDLRAGSWGLDVLALLAIASTLAVGDTWAAALVGLMVAGGQALEGFAQRRARRHLTQACSPARRRLAQRLDADGPAQPVPVEQVEPGDRLLVTAYALVPVDGTLLDDEADLDESSLTGESLPVPHRRGAALLSGSVNGGRAFRMLATATAGASQYQQVVALVRDATASRPRFVRLADRAAVPFTVVALLVAGTAWAMSGDPVRFAEVLVVATPCPLLIAAPVAYVAGMTRAARSGIIIKDTASIERLAAARTFAFDKTGTLTRGRPRVVRLEPADGVGGLRLLSVAAALERESNHVLAAAVVAEAERLGAPPAAVQDIEEATAMGMQGVLDGERVRAGRASFALPGAAAGPGRSGQAAETRVHVSVGGRPLGAVVLADEARPESASTLAALRAWGVDGIVLVTGDGSDAAAVIAREVGIGAVHAGLLPAEKVRIVAELPERPVVMVGDGVNDAPVLASADVGIAMAARGSTAASETADIAIVPDDLSRVADLVAIARRTSAVARQSVVAGIAISVALMLIAATGAIPAAVGALLQEAIDVVAILNALRAGAGSLPRPHPRRAR
ncbi:heavy metal translocating P-type ATPase [Agrococcus sp. SL85]|uniref:heavy metal translocating P-type ATPase n=1 Tax=Agrococcus sp. SL85 TaxID=2995141 RepID=UPI00226CD7B5|nr:heavy metal translocating P-type ATPase [Agrococcus sp. SL85]WAC66920.1 heavy metal translocating P-type ATPase [Agrococcus sp. SL85]